MTLYMEVRPASCIPKSLISHHIVLFWVQMLNMGFPPFTSKIGFVLGVAWGRSSGGFGYSLSSVEGLSSGVFLRGSPPAS